MKKRYKQIICLLTLIVLLLVSSTANAFAASDSDLIGYLSKCRFLPSNGTLELTERTYLKYLPCSVKTNSASFDVGVYEAGKTFTVTGLYINTEGNFWYRVTDGNKLGYVYNSYGTFSDGSIDFTYYYVVNNQLYISDSTKHMCYAVSASTASSIPISTEQIDTICQAFGYEDNSYWVYNESNDLSNHPLLPYDWYAASSKHDYYTSSQIGSGLTLSYYCGGNNECAGFANFMGLMLTGQLPKNGEADYASNIGNGWASYSTTQIIEMGGVKPGDILRNYGHSAMVYTVNSDGSFHTIEVWGRSANVIHINGFFNGREDYSKLDQIPDMIYVLRYEG